MQSVPARDAKEMLLGVEFTVLGGVALLYGLLTDLGVLWAVGLIGVAFGFYVTVDSYANGANPRTGGDADREE